jgi:predicted transcriptional regulator
MPATRISPRGHERLQRLAEETGQSHQEVIDRALEAYEREHMLDALNASFAELKADPQQWSEELAERAQWDTTAGDFGGDS